VVAGTGDGATSVVGAGVAAASSASAFPLPSLWPSRAPTSRPFLAPARLPARAPRACAPCWARSRLCS